MVNYNSKIKRLIKRSNEELFSTFRIYKFSGFRDAIVSLRAKLLVQKINKKGLVESDKNVEILRKKHKIVSNYIYHIMHSYIDSYDYNSKLPNGNNMENTIWICWWQGLENAPNIVKKCIDSIRKNVKNYNVVIITDKNYKSYVNLPEWLVIKKDKGLISKTHFSDILRFRLLAEHGGIWLDSTFYCTSNKIEKLFDLPLWTIKRPEYGHLSPACGYFANYSFGCKYANRDVFNVICNFLLEYWKNNDYIIDYLLTDYIINIVLDSNNKFKKLFDDIPNNNKNCDELFKILGVCYDENLWNSIKQDTFLFKLSWKHRFDIEKNGNKTFYGMLIEKY